MEGRRKRKTTSYTSKKTRKEPSRSNPHFKPSLNSLGIKFAEQRFADRFATLSHIRIKPTQFPSEEALRNLGVYENIRTLHNGLGCAPFLSLHANTYSRLTLEFLSTMIGRSGIVTNQTGVQVEESFLEFSLFNQNHVLSFTRINEIFGWPASRGLTLNLSDDFNDGVFWQQITGSNHYDPRTAKASSIIHPVIRIIHRIYVCTIFGRKDKGTINKTELYFLWAFVTPHNGINLAKWFVNHLWGIHDVNFSGEIHIGGLITILARELGVVIPENLVAVSGSTRLDIKALKKMQMIEEGDNRTYTWLVGSTKYTTLPNPNLQMVRINQPQTWTTPQTIDQVPGQEENQVGQGNQGQQFPPNFFDQFNQMVNQVNQMSQQNNQMTQQVNQMSQQMNYMYDYAAAHWPDFQPPPQINQQLAKSPVRPTL